jgi:hypothetical protein
MASVGRKSPISRGRCVFCDAALAKSSATRHLAACPRRQEARAQTAGTKKERSFDLVVDYRYAPGAYWAYLEVAASAQLWDLDAFLRRIWLECCGHLSEFRLGGESYSAAPGDLFDAADDDMGVRVSRVLRLALTGEYLYDFGSTTELRARVVAENPSRSSDALVLLLARNEPPQWSCGKCGAAAALICSECAWSGEGLFCKKCARRHEHGDEYCLPVVNSPRMGVCGYTGD